MYAPNMRTCFCGALAAVWILAGCHTASRQATTPTPEAEQVISKQLKDHYMALSMVPPQSAAQQKLILQMAQEATNGKELLLVMRAAIGVFPAPSGGKQSAMEHEVCSRVTARMLSVATLDQLADYAMEYPIDSGDARRFLERMFDLGNQSADAQSWYRIRAAAFHLKVNDLERQAQARGDQLAPQ